MTAAGDTVTLPFSEQQFLDVFGDYNSRMWPIVVLLWIATLGLGAQLVRGRVTSAALSLLLTFHWAWSGLVYHALFFSAVNPGAWLFALLFAVESAIFLRLAVTRRIEYVWGHGAQHKIAAVLIAYALAYPVLVLASGYDYPRAPLFAVPCPTTLFTCGVLLTAVPRVPVVASVVPVAWSVIAGSAAIVLGVTPDAMVFIAGAAVVMAAIARRPGPSTSVLMTTSGAKRP
jgi:hypothetical protein